MPGPTERQRSGGNAESDVDFISDDEIDTIGSSAGGAGPLGTSGGGAVPTGAATWQEVDRAELSGAALALISSIAQTAPTDDKSRDAVWHPTTTVTVTQELEDPLGMGRIDATTLRLERQQQRDVSARSSAGGVGAVDAGAAAQSRGAVGRFFSELTARSTSGGGRSTGGGAGRPSSRGAGSEAGASARGRVSTLGRASSLPLNQLLPTMEGFDPEAYLAVFHASTSAEDLAAGLGALERELGERQGQLKQLVKQNFDRFISCKTTIDDIYVKLQRIESAGSGGASTAVLFNAVQDVQGAAKRAFGPLLDRHSQAERIKSVQALLRRFQALFSAPSRVRSLAAAHDYEQVCAEYKKANALIRPTAGSTARVWAKLHSEIEKRVTEVWRQLEAEVQQPELPAASAPDLLLQMLALQAEGLPIAQGKDPVGLLLDARDRGLRTGMAAAQERYARGMARLKERYCAAAAAAGTKVDPARVTEHQLLVWSEADLRHSHDTPTTAATGHSDGPAPSQDASGIVTWGVGGTAAGLASSSPLVIGGASSTAPLSALAGAGIGGGSGGIGGGGAGNPGARLAPLSGLQPPPLQSRLVQHTEETPGEALVLGLVGDLSAVALACLPGFWSTAASPRLADAPDLPPAMRSRLRQSIKMAAATAQKLVDSYCRELQQITGSLVAVGPLRAATAALIQTLSRIVAALREDRAPPAAVDAVLGVLRYALEAAVRQLAGHLEQLPAALVAREGWGVSLTHSGDEAPVTHLPEQLQEEITVAVAYYKALTSTAAAVLDGQLPRDITTRPLHVAFFACLGQTTACLSSLAERFSPPPAAGESPASVGSGGGVGSPEARGAAAAAGSPSPRRPGSSASPAAAQRRAALLNADSDSDDDGSGTASGRSPGGRGGGGGAAAAVGGSALGLGRGGLVGVSEVVGLSDDVRLLLTASNLSYLRTRLMGSLTQRFLLVLTGEVESEVERVGRTVAGLAKRMDTALQAMYDSYLERKRRRLDRLMGSYVRPDGAPVGLPAELRDVSPGVQTLLQALAQVQAETYAYARVHSSFLLARVLEHTASSLSARYAALRPGALPPEALAQYFLDLVWLDGVVAAAGPSSLRVDIDTGYTLLAQRIAAGTSGAPEATGSRSGGSSGGSAPLTPLGRSLAAVRDPAELSKKLQITCRKLLPDILGRSTFTIRSFLAV